jgi:hypothetical protein
MYFVLSKLLNTIMYKVQHQSCLDKIIAFIITLFKIECHGKLLYHN